jgi:hypothetical protein
MPKRIRLVSSLTESEQKQVLRHVALLACRSDEFYSRVRTCTAAHIGVTTQWLNHAVEEARGASLGANVTPRKDEGGHAA